MSRHAIVRVRKYLLICVLTSTLATGDYGRFRRRLVSTGRSSRRFKASTTRVPSNWSRVWPSLPMPQATNLERCEAHNGVRRCSWVIAHAVYLAERLSFSTFRLDLTKGTVL